MFPASNEVAMNCQSCNTRIDYRFVTNCEECGCPVEPAGVSEYHPNLESPAPVKKRLGWMGRLINTIYVLTVSTFGLVSGTIIFAIATMFLGMIERAIYPPNPNVSGCGRGQLISLIMMTSGAFLGTVGAAAFSARRPVFKSQIH
jgi:hypothetical protein